MFGSRHRRLQIHFIPGLQTNQYPFICKFYFELTWLSLFRLDSIVPIAYNSIYSKLILVVVSRSFSLRFRTIAEQQKTSPQLQRVNRKRTKKKKRTSQKREANPGQQSQQRRRRRRRKNHGRNDSHLCNGLGKQF